MIPDELTIWQLFWLYEYKKIFLISLNWNIYLTPADPRDYVRFYPAIPRYKEITFKPTRENSSNNSENRIKTQSAFKEKLTVKKKDWHKAIDKDGIVTVLNFLIVGAQTRV